MVITEFRQTIFRYLFTFACNDVPFVRLSLFCAGDDLIWIIVWDYCSSVSINVMSIGLIERTWLFHYLCPCVHMIHDAYNFGANFNFWSTIILVQIANFGNTNKVKVLGAS